MYPTDAPSINEIHSDANAGHFGLPDDLAAEMSLRLGWNNRPNEAEIDAMWIDEMERRDAKSTNGDVSTAA